MEQQIDGSREDDAKAGGAEDLQKPEAKAEEEEASAPPVKTGGDATDTAKTPSSDPSAEDEDGGRIIYGKDVPNESDAIQYKWNAIFYNFSAEEKTRLALDEVSMFSVTDTRSAHNTSKIIQKLVGERATVTDGCAAAGGNTFAFAQHFAKVNAVELNAQRFGLLKQNLEVLGLDKKVACFNENYLTLIDTLEQDVVFLDPPWGGKAYTENDKITLTFGGVPLAEVCERIKPKARFIALKLPLNYDLDHLSSRVTSSIIRADDRCARKMLFVVLDTSGRESRGGYKRGRDHDDRPAPWTIKRK